MRAASSSRVSGGTRRWRWRERARASQPAAGEGRADDRAIVIKHVGQRRVRAGAACPASAVQAASGVRLRAGTAVHAVDGHQHFADPDRRAGRDAHGARFILRRAVGVSASTRSRTWPTWRSPAVRAPGRNSQWRWAGVRAGGALASQPAARGGRNAAGRIMAAYYAKSARPCGVMPQAGRRRAGHTMAAMEKYASPSSCPSVGFAPRGRWLYRARLGPRRRRGGVRTGCPRVSRPGHHAGTRRAGAPDLARHDTDQQAGGLCVRPGREGLYRPWC